MNSRLPWVLRQGRFPILVLLAIGWMPGLVPSFAWSLELTARVDRSQVTLEDTVHLSVTAEGVRQSPAPQFPPLPDFEIQGRGTQSTMQMVNGQTTQSVTFNYLLLPKREGTFVIDGIQISKDGKTYRASPVKLTVTAPAQVDVPIDQREVFAEMSLSRTEPFLQEQVRLSYRLYHRVPVRNVEIDAPLNGFRKIPLGQPIQFSRRIKGVEFHVYELNYALFPMHEGVIEIPPGRFRVDVVQPDKRRPGPFDLFNLPHQFDSFFGGAQRLVRKNLITESIKVTVKKTPQLNQPTHYQGLVGKFQIKQEISKTVLEAGDTATLKITLVGNGNLMPAKLASLENIPGLKVYEDKPQIKENIEGNELISEKTFIFALVPGVGKEMKLPEISIPYFDPEQETYRKLSTSDIILTILPGKGPGIPRATRDLSSENQHPTTSPGVGPALLPIHTKREDFQQASMPSPMVWAGALLLPPLAYFGGITWYRKKIRLKQDLTFRRFSQARSKAMERLQSLLQDMEPREKTRRASSLVRDFIGDKLNLQGTALTPEEIRRVLQTRGFNEKDLQPVDEFLERCEAVEFAAAGIHNERLDFSKSVRELIDHLDKRI